MRGYNQQTGSNLLPSRISVLQLAFWKQQINKQCIIFLLLIKRNIFCISAYDKKQSRKETTVGQAPCFQASVVTLCDNKERSTECAQKSRAEVGRVRNTGPEKQAGERPAERTEGVKFTYGLGICCLWPRAVSLYTQAFCTKQKNITSFEDKFYLKFYPKFQS